MFSCYIFVVVSLINFLPDFQVSSCDPNCADKPRFTPSRLVVQFGKPTSAHCSVCQPGCNVSLFDIESSIGTKKTNGTEITWTVDKMAEWTISTTCYYTNDTTNEQCCSVLPITVYKPPYNVSFSVHPDEPMSEGQQYTLQCDVRDVAPVENLRVTFYRGQTALGHTQSSNTDEKPVSEVFTWNITSTKEDDGVQFWCEAKLELGADGPQPPPVLGSEKLTAAVRSTSSAVSVSTPAPPLPSQISPRSPSAWILPSPPSSPLSVSEVGCPLTLTPSSLVVRFGDPVTANCSLSRAGFLGVGWDVSLAAPDFTMDCFLVWSVERMTEWSMEPLCYAISEQGGLCQRNLPLTVYKPPENVSISFVNHTGPMSEGQQYTLHCEVQDVAPVENLTVTFYRGKTALGHTQSSNTDKEPVSEVFTFNITSTKENDGVEFWCEAKLELGADGPQPPPVMGSEKLTAAVHYKPQLEGSIPPDPIIITEGNPLTLNCSSVGNPPPSYTWRTLGITSPSDGSVFFINSITHKDEGSYTCSVSNEIGSITVEFDVTVQGLSQADHLTLIIGLVLAAILLAVIVVVVVFISCHRHTASTTRHRRSPRAPDLGGRGGKHFSS